MRQTDGVGAAHQVAVDLSREWTPVLAVVGVGFSLRLMRHLAPRGVEQGLQLFVWPLSGFDNYFEVWRVQSWLGRRHTVAPLSEVAAKLRTTLAAYAEDPA